MCMCGHVPVCALQWNVHMHICMHTPKCSQTCILTQEARGRVRDEDKVWIDPFILHALPFPSFVCLKHAPLMGIGVGMVWPVGNSL